jgi:hypothetical protein
LGDLKLLDIVAHHDKSAGDHSAMTSGRPVDIDSLDLAKLDQLMAEKAMKVPQNWESWSLSTKIAWIKLQLEPAPGAEMISKRVNFGAEQSALAKAQGRSRVSLMTSLAALANPIEGKVVESGDRAATTFPTVVAWGPDANGLAVAQHGGVDQADPLRFVIEETDALDEREALAAVGKLTNQSEATLFRLGGVLGRLKSRGWRKSYPTFKAFVEAEHEIPYRTATQWMAIYRRLADSKITWEKAQGVGWGKLKEIASVITRNNADEWLKIASENTTPALARIVASHKKAGAPPALESKAAGASARMTFNLDSSQTGAVQAAIEKAKTEAGAPDAAVALGNICANYVSGETFKHEARAMGLEACLRLIEATYPSARLKVAFVEE